MSVATSATVRVLVRALSLIGVALTGWANNVRWGTSEVRAGPPAQWERIAVGAALLAALAALAVWIGTRSGLGVTRTWWRGAACLFAAGIVAIALQLRAQADRLQLPDLVEGPGWSWLAAGAGAALAAAVGSFALRGDVPISRKKRARRRATAQRAR
jgi:hypothetical protein